MTRDEVLQDLQERFKNDIIEFFDKSPHRLYVEVKPDAVVRVGVYLFRTLKARFNIASGTDVPPNNIEVLYHFTIEDINLLVSLRIKLDRDNAVSKSLGAEIEAVNWIEREMAELLGITFTGHPDPRHLLLHAEWPEGVYPLRQDYEEWDETADRTRGV